MADTFSKDFCWPSRAKGIIDRDLKFTEYVPHYKILTNVKEIMGWESSGVVKFDLGPLFQGQTRIPKLKSAYNSLIIGPRGLQCETNL